MTTTGWSYVLQFARLGVTGAVFLLAARFLTLAEIGAFATAFAPLRLAQILHRSGIGEAVVLAPEHPIDRARLFTLSILCGSGIALAALAVSLWARAPLLAVLACVPLFNALGAVPDGMLRRAQKVKALALRTCVVQTMAALVTIWAMARGWGPWGLALFVVMNAGFGAAASMALARWRPSIALPGPALLVPLRDVALISARDLASAAPQTILQVSIGLVVGFSAAGAFQIATRAVGMLDALAVAPLRYVALPKFAALRSSTRLQELPVMIRKVTAVSAWVYLGAFAAAPHILAIAVGLGPVAETAPLFRVLCLVGLFSALLMPLNQALMASGGLSLVFMRAAVGLVAALVLALPLTWAGALPATLGLAVSFGLVAIWYVPRACRFVELPARTLAPSLWPLAAGGLMCFALLILPEDTFAASGWSALGLEMAIGSALFAALLALPRRNPQP